MPVEQIRTKRLYREVADQLTSLIASGEFKKGERLPAERELAGTLGVSRPTIREAMIALEIAGLVEIRTGAGIYVISDNTQARAEPAPDIGPGPFELIEARAHFEGEAAAIAAARISETELQTLEEACQEMAQAIEAGLSAEAADHRFHMTIAEASRNSAVLATVQHLWSYRTRMPMWQKLHDVISDLSDTPGWTNDRHTLMDHRRILNALRARDADAARLAMRGHLDHVKAALLQASELEAIDLNELRFPSAAGPQS